MFLSCVFVEFLVFLVFLLFPLFLVFLMFLVFLHGVPDVPMFLMLSAHGVSSQQHAHCDLSMSSVRHDVIVLGVETTVVANPCKLL